MKPLSECKWEVEIHSTHGYNFFVAEIDDDDTGVNYSVFIGTDEDSEETAKNSWEKFAKINNIKNWEWV